MEYHDLRIISIPKLFWHFLGLGIFSRASAFYFSLGFFFGVGRKKKPKFMLGRFLCPQVLIGMGEDLCHLQLEVKLA